MKVECHVTTEAETEVLQLQTTLFQNRLSEIKALVNYNINLANLRYTEGATLENYNIEVVYE